MTSTVHQAWAAVMVDVAGVAKRERNTQQGYSFRGIDAVVNAAGPAMRAHGVAVLPTLLAATYRDVEVGGKRTPMREATVRVRYTIIGPAGDTLAGVVPGEAMDSGDKGVAKAMSVAYRIFLLQSLTIPTDEPDPDESSYERAAAEPEPADGPISAENVERLRQRCAERELSIAEVARLTTDGRTEDPSQILRSEVPAIREALGLLTPVDESSAAQETSA